MNRLTATDCAEIYRWATAKRLLNRADASAIFFDFDLLDERLDHLATTFPKNTLHAVAIKSNPLLEVLKHIAQRGFGLEAATFEEVLLAKKAGAANEKIVFDSPVKRQSEINFCEKNLPGLIVNANTIKELRRYRNCRNLQLGLRVNPLTDAGSPGIYAVSDYGSKFGEPITNRAAIVRAFLEMPLTGLHIHIGSGIENLESTATAMASLFELANEIETARSAVGNSLKINRLDIGGGFLGIYQEGQQPGLEPYVSLLRAKIPDLEKRQLITEYGRFTQVHAGWILSDIEYVLDHNDPPTLALHHGADMFVREVYSPEGPCHRVFALDKKGEPKTGQPRPYNLAGPLCFAGDFLAKNQLLPGKITTSDKIVVADTGANTFSIWSKHCSRAFPKALGYSRLRGEIRVLKKRETAKQAIEFWS